MSTIVIASGNQGKIHEFNQLFADHPYRFASQKSFNVSEIEETGTTFIENAILKARNASDQTGLPAIADDSGLEVDIISGQPGIYSARFSGPEATDQSNNKKLISLLIEYPDKSCTARFHCVLALMKHAKDPTPMICHGIWEGVISLSPYGENGFGYDPHFFIPEFGKTSAELPAEEKNRLSHRGKAMQQLLQQLPSLNLKISD